MDSLEEKLKEFKNLSHDIQNILSTIVNNSRLLKQNANTSVQGTKYANIIENNSLRASEIIHEYLSGKKTQKREIDSAALFDDIASSFCNTLPTQIIFKSNNTAPQSRIFGNYSDLYRVFLNLLINAKEAINGNGVIEFERKETQNNLVNFIVLDNGCGIPKDKIANIFDSGFSTKDKGRESGLGLNIVKEIIENHKGFIEVKSEINKNTQFVISIPEFIEKKTEGLKKCILIADDDNSLRESLADLFESYNFTTLQAKNGEEVLEIINHNSEIDLLIVDKKMPKKDGIKCITEIRNANNELPIVLVTGINLDLSELDELESNKGANKIVLKPYDFIYLKEIVESLIF